MDSSFTAVYTTNLWYDFYIQNLNNEVILCEKYTLNKNYVLF